MNQELPVGAKMRALNNKTKPTLIFTKKPKPTIIFEKKEPVKINRRRLA